MVNQTDGRFNLNLPQLISVHQRNSLIRQWKWVCTLTGAGVLVYTTDCDLPSRLLDWTPQYYKISFATIIILILQKYMSEIYTVHNFSVSICIVSNLGVKSLVHYYMIWKSNK